MERLFDAGDAAGDPEADPPARPTAPVPGGPLAARMRPRALDAFVGQEHLLGEGSALRA